MDIDHAHTIVHEVLVDEFEIERALIRAGATLGEDLDLDSLDRVDLIVSLEKTLGVRFGEDDVKAVRTVADLVACVERAEIRTA
jgi:acyl carrier protein